MPKADIKSPRKITLANALTFDSSSNRFRLNGSQSTV